MKFDTIIKSEKKWFDFNFNELFRYKDLIFLFVRRTFVSQYKQTILGPIWAIIQPLLTTIVFTIIFGGIAQLPTDGAPTFIFYMCGNIAWTYFATTLTTTSNTFVTNAPISVSYTHLDVYKRQSLDILKEISLNLIFFFLMMIKVFMMKKLNH